MVDEIFDRQYQSSRKQLHASISNTLDRLSQAVSRTFEVLVKIQFQAPWTAKSNRAHGN